MARQVEAAPKTHMPHLGHVPIRWMMGWDAAKSSMMCHTLPAWAKRGSSGLGHATGVHRMVLPGGNAPWGHEGLLDREWGTAAGRWPAQELT